MPTLNQIASTSINKSTTFPSQAGFGTPGFICYLDGMKPGKRILRYGSPDEAVADGFAVTHRVYRALQKAFSQSPSPPEVVIGARFLPSTQVIVLTPVNLTVGYEYAFTVVDNAGTEWPISYVVQASDTATLISTGLKADLDAIPDMVTSGTATVICTSTVGKLLEYKDLPPIADMRISETTTDPGVATDLAAIALEAERQGVSFYSFSLDSSGEAEVNNARAWAEASPGYVFSARTSDSLAADAGTTTDVISDAKAAASQRTHIIFAQYSTLDYRDLAFAAKFLSVNVPEGSATPAYKTLGGITRDKLTSAECNAINDKYGTTYTTLKGVNITYQGQVGDGDWFDTTCNLDWLKARSQEAFFGALLANKKIAYTQKGIDLIAGTVQAVFDRAVQQGILSPVDDEGNPPKVTPPKRTATTAANRAARILPNVICTGVLAGAIHRASFQFQIGV